MMHVITLDYVMPLSVSEYVICIKPRVFFFFFFCHKTVVRRRAAEG